MTFPTHNLSCQLAVVFIPLIFGCGRIKPEEFACVDADLTRDLHLSERFAVEIGGNGRPIAIAGDTDVLAIAVEGDARIQVLSGTKSMGKTQPVSNVIGLAVDPSGAIEAYNGTDFTLHRFQNLQARPRVTKLARPPVSVHTAAKAFGHWYVGGVTPSGRFVVFRHFANGLQGVVDFGPDAETAFLSAAFSASPEFLIVTETRYPYRTRLIDNNDKVSSVFEFGYDLGANPGPSRIALPLIAMKGGFLVTLTDLASDQRQFVVLNRSGHVMRTRVVMSPVALVRLFHGGRRVLGVRHLRKPQVVLYACLREPTDA